MHYLLFYEVGEDYVQRRAEFRDAHLAKVWGASVRGELVLGGALAHPADGAVLLFQGESPEVAKNFAKTDPYVTSGLVKRWHVREWATVVGKDAATPVRPSAPVASDAAPPAEEKKGMILRQWTARTTPENAPLYARHVTTKVFPALARIQGHRGAYLLQRERGETMEIVVFTLWDSMDAVRKFAGAEAEKAVVEPEAQAVLTDFDKTVTHFGVVHRR